MEQYKNYLGLGIAGNFALHLAQAGELEDFKNVLTEDEAAPKGMFPFYLPNLKSKKMLTNYPLSSDTIKLPNKDVNIQAEPEVGLICKLEYKNKQLSNIIPEYFGAYNDCSIRIGGATKISDKKNWGKDSKGISQTLFKIDEFNENSDIKDFSIASFLKRDKEVYAYGENTELTGYSYFYNKLIQWMIHQINTQKDFGPLEPLNEYISECNYPDKAIISIGATRYTEYGEKTFLKENDEIIIIVYNHTKNSLTQIQDSINANKYDTDTMSVLSQHVVK